MSPQNLLAIQLELSRTELIPTFGQAIDFADSSQSCRDRHPHFPLLFFLEPESEVCTIDQGVTCVSRFSMTAIIASLAKPRALIARASEPSRRDYGAAKRMCARSPSGDASLRSHPSCRCV